MSVLRKCFRVNRLPEVAVSAPWIKSFFLMYDFPSRKAFTLLLVFNGNTYGETCFKASLGYFNHFGVFFPLLVGKAVGIFNHRPR